MTEPQIHEEPDPAEAGAEETQLAAELDGSLRDGAAELEAAGSLAAPVEALAQLRAALKPRPAVALPEVPGFSFRGEMGRGGMGVVVRAFDAALQREVAVKFLNETLAENGEARDRFVKEARTLAKLRHPNLLSVHSAGEVDGRPYFTMELVEGMALDKAIEKCKKREGGPMPVEPGERARTAARLFAEAAEALVTVHRAGLLHRDVKPANLLIAADGTVRLADFGIALDRRQFQEAYDAGTLRYVAPERLEGVETPASDVYSLGISLLESVLLRPVFRGKSTAELRTAIAGGIPVLEPAEIRGIPTELLALARRACARNVADRFADAAELARELRSFLDRKWYMRPPGMALGAVAVVFVGIGIGALAGAFRGERDPLPEGAVPLQGRPGLRPGPGPNRGPREELGPAGPFRPPGPQSGPGGDLRRMREAMRSRNLTEFERLAGRYESASDGPPEHFLVLAWIAQLRGDGKRAAAGLEKIRVEDLPPPLRLEAAALRAELDGLPPPRQRPR